MKIYNGVITNGEHDVYVGGTGIDAHRLDPRYDLANHSPDGFCWGYVGSGPSQLALAMLADHLADDRRAVQLYHQFHWNVIARLAGDKPFVLGPREIDHAVRCIEAETTT